MNRLCSLILLAALAAFLPAMLVAGETALAPTQPPTQADKARESAPPPKAKRARASSAKASSAKANSAKAKNPKANPAKASPTKTASAKAGQDKTAKPEPSLTREELLSPFSAAQGQPGQTDRPGQNATQWFFDTSPTAKPLGAQQDDSALNLRLGSDRKVDPITGEELKRRLDPLGAKDDLKNLDLKGAMDKVGGKAEVQVEILKF